MTTTAPTVKVALRVRPLKNEFDNQVIRIQDEKRIYFNNEAFDFDNVYSPQSSQEEIYKKNIVPIMDDFITGENVAILAYGQAGSGKTFSMGTGSESNLDQGLIQRFTNSLFEKMIEKNSKSLGTNSFEIYVSCLKIHEQDMDDLLMTNRAENMEKVNSVNDVLRFLKKGLELNRNSLTIFSIILEQYIGKQDMITLVENDIPTTDKHIISKFNFVHLDASDKSQPSLLALGNVLSALGDSNRRHVPFEDCKLTRFLKDCKNHILLLTCVSPSSSDYTETLKTLEFVRNIQNNLLLPNDHELLRQEMNRSQQYLAEIDHLKQQLAETRQHYLHAPSASSSLTKRLNNSKKRPVIHRMKSTQSSCCLPKKKNQTMDQLLDLLRKEYLPQDEKSIDETVLFLPSHGEEADANQDENELEALSVPSWSDAPKSSNISSKRKSISLDSMWDDTDSSITTSRTTTKLVVTPTKSKDSKRQSKNILKMLHQIQADLLVKRELVDQLEKAQQEYSQMKSNYEERLNEFKDHILELQGQRDAALKKSGTTIVPTPGKTTRPVLQLRENRQAQDVRSQYEVKLKLLVAENHDLRKKHSQSTLSIQTARAKAEGIIGRLRADIEALKLEKKQLNKGLKIEVDKSREAIASYEREVQHLKRREIIALDAKKKLEQVNEAQSQVLKKRTEETAAVNLQIRQLTNVLRRAANEGTFLNELTLERLLNDPLASPSPKNVIRRPISRILTGNSSTTSSPID